MDRQLLTVEEAAEALSIGRSTMYTLISRDEISTVQIGRLRRVPVRSVEAYLRVLGGEV